MKKLLILTAAIIFHVTFAAENSEFSEIKLKVRQPNWLSRTVKIFPDGSPHVVLFYAPIPNSVFDTPVKQLEFTAEGDLRGETDLIVIEDGGVVPHGASVWYYPGRLIQKIARFDKGKLDGPVRSFYKNGQLQKQMIAVQGTYHGAFTIYDQEGNLLQEGGYSKGKPEGDFILYHPNGRRALLSHYERGVLEGEVTEWYENGAIKTSKWYLGGVLHRDSKSGPAVTFYDAQQKTQEVQYFTNGRLHGPHIVYAFDGKEKEKVLYKNGVRLDGKAKKVTKVDEAKKENGFQNDLKKSLVGERLGRGDVSLSEKKLDGFVETFHSNGALATRVFYIEGILDGVQESYYPDGTKQAMINYEKGLIHGPKTFWGKNGELMLEATYEHGLLEGPYFEKMAGGEEIYYTFKNNRPHGIHVVYYPPNESGEKIKALEESYVNGVLEGERSEYNAKGIKITSTFYKDGLKEGFITLYNSEGKVLFTAACKADKQQGLAIQYHPNGNIQKQAYFIDDIKEGEEKTFYENGKLASKCFYVGGQLDGLYQEWNPKGVLICTINFVNGKRHGKFFKYGPDGQLHVQQTYVHGELSNPQ